VIQVSKLSKMADEQELLRAAQELSQFAGHLKPTPPLFGSGSGAPTVPESPLQSTAASQAEEPATTDMDTSARDKRTETDAQDLEKEEPPSKWQKATGKGEGSKEQAPEPPATDRPRRSPQRGQASQPSNPKPYNRRDWGHTSRYGDHPWWMQDSEHDNKKEKELRELMKELVRLVLRQADTIAYLQMDLGFMVFLKTTMQPQMREGEADTASTGQWAIVQNLFQAAEAWHDKKQNDPGSLNATLRTTLMYCLVGTLLERVEALEDKPQDVLRLEKLGLVEEGKFLYLRWNQTTKKHEKSEQEHMPIAQAKAYLAQIKQNLIFPKVILRFHALRRLTSNMTSDIVPFTLEIHNRCQESQTTYLALERLSFNSVWHLIGGTVRPAKLGRGPLERSVEDAAKRL